MKRPRAMHVLWALTGVWVVACLLVAQRADAWLQAGPSFETRGGPLVVAGRHLTEAVQDGGERFRVLPDGVRLYADVDVTFRTDATRDGTTTTPFFVVARGRPLDGVWPLLTLEVDRDPVGGFYVTSTDWGLYRVDLQLSPVEHHFRLSFVNDASRFPNDRNVDLQSISLGAAPPEVEPLARWRAPCAIPAQRMAEQVFAEPRADGLFMWGGGSAGDHVLVPDGGATTFGILADTAEGQGRVEVAVDGRPVAGFDISDSLEWLTTTIDVDPGWHHIGLSRPGQRRDAPFVRIRRIVVGEPAPSLSPGSGPLRLSGALEAVGPDGLDLDSGSSTDGTERVLWSNGFIGRTVEVARAGAWRLTLSARAELCHGVGPRVLVLSGVDQIAELHVDSESAGDYGVVLPLGPGTHEILFVYVNDTSIPGVCDRNLRVSELRFAPGASD